MKSGILSSQFDSLLTAMVATFVTAVPVLFTGCGGGTRDLAPQL